MTGYKSAEERLGGGGGGGQSSAGGPDECELTITRDTLPTGMANKHTASCGYLNVIVCRQF